jgi:hypothetical protein
VVPDTNNMGESDRDERSEGMIGGQLSFTARPYRKECSRFGKVVVKLWIKAGRDGDEVKRLQ